MNRGRKRAVKAIRAYNEETNEPRKRYRRGLLGRGLSDEKTAKVPGRTNTYYVRNRQNPSQIWEVGGTDVPNIPGLPVLLEADDFDRTRMQIKGWDWRGMSNLPGMSGNVIGEHAAQHGVHGWDMLDVDKGMVRPLRIRPTQPLSPDVLLEFDALPYIGTKLIDMEAMSGYETNPIRGVRRRLLQPTGTLQQSRYYMAVLTDEPDLVFITGSPFNPMPGGFFVSGTTSTTYPAPELAVPLNGVPLAYIFAGATATVVRYQDIDDIRPLHTFPGREWATGTLIEDRGSFYTGSTVEQALQEIGEFKGKVKVTFDDPTPAYLQASVQEGPGISLSVVTSGSDKLLRISATGTSTTSLRVMDNFGTVLSNVNTLIFSSGTVSSGGTSTAVVVNGGGGSSSNCDCWNPWSLVTGGRTLLVSGDYSWVNQGSSTITTNIDGSVTLYTPASGASELTMRVKSAPSTPYTITAGMLLTLHPANYSMAGLCWRDSVSGKVITFHLVYDTGNGDWGLNKWDSATTYNSTYTNLLIGALVSPILWLRISDDGTNRKAQVSADGLNFITLHSVGRTDFLTADQVGFFTSPYASNKELYATLLSWKQT